MTFFGPVESETRRSLDELDPGLRDRVRALDEPVARADWREVVARSRAQGPWGGRMRAAAAGIAGTALVVVVGLMIVGPRFSAGTSSRASSATPRSAARALSGFQLAQGAVGSGANALASDTRVITSLEMNGNSRALYLSPGRSGGFCYRWTGDARGL